MCLQAVWDQLWPTASQAQLIAICPQGQQIVAWQVCQTTMTRLIQSVPVSKRANSDISHRVHDTCSSLISHSTVLSPSLEACPRATRSHRSSLLLCGCHLQIVEAAVEKKWKGDPHTEYCLWFHCYYAV